MFEYKHCLFLFLALLAIASPCVGMQAPVPQDSEHYSFATEDEAAELLAGPHAPRPAAGRKKPSVRIDLVTDGRDMTDMLDETIKAEVYEWFLPLEKMEEDPLRYVDRLVNSLEKCMDKTPKSWIYIALLAGSCDALCTGFAIEEPKFLHDEGTSTYLLTTSRADWRYRINKTLSALRARVSGVQIITREEDVPPQDRDIYRDCKQYWQAQEPSSKLTGLVKTAAQKCNIRQQIILLELPADSARAGCTRIHPQRARIATPVIAIDPSCDDIDFIIYHELRHTQQDFYIKDRIKHGSRGIKKDAELSLLKEYDADHFAICRCLEENNIVPVALLLQSRLERISQGNLSDHSEKVFNPHPPRVAIVRMILDELERHHYDVHNLHIEDIPLINIYNGTTLTGAQLQAKINELLPYAEPGHLPVITRTIIKIQDRIRFWGQSRAGFKLTATISAVVLPAFLVAAFVLKDKNIKW